MQLTFSLGCAIYLFRYISCFSFTDLSHSNRICLKVADNEMYRTALKPRADSCDGWSCWQSQLTLANKVRITRVINDFRDAHAENVTSMNELVWHWALEHEAIRASESCARRYLEKYDVRRNIEGLGFSLFCENGCMRVVLTQNPSQILFVEILPHLLRNNSLEDYDERANAIYFGCALVVRSAVTERGAYEDIYHFVCVFCTNENDMTSNYKKTPKDQPSCPSLTARGGEHPHLCRPKSRRSVYMCPPTNPCTEKGTEKPPFWLSPDPGKITELIMVETNTGPVLLVNETSVGDLDAAGHPISITSSQHLDTDGEYVEILSHYPPVPKYVYLYSSNDLQFYGNLVQRYSNSKVIPMKPEITEVALKYSIADAMIGAHDAWCCEWLLALTCFPTVVLVLLICYTCKQSWLVVEEKK